MVLAGFPPPYGDCEHLRPSVGIEETNNPIQAGGDIFRGLRLTLQCFQEIQKNNSNGGVGTAQQFFGDFQFILGYVKPSELLTVLGFAVLWTIARYFLSKLIFKPFANWLGVQPKNIDKLAESSWKTLAYGIMWSYSVAVVFFHGYDFFYEPMQQFSDWKIDSVPKDLSLIYALELSFYLHSVYGTLYMDAWRKDSIVMMVHHFVSMTLISFSYAIRCVKIGVLIFALNDIGDILLETGKLATYLRHRKSGFSAFFDFISNITAVLFGITWFTNRLWCHPTKIWRPAALGVWASHPVLPLPFHLFLNSFLGTLYVFYIYWFWFIIVFVFRVMTGKSGSAEDPREDRDTSTPHRKKKPAKLE